MITDKVTLLVLLVFIFRYANSLTCLAPTITFGPCHDGLKERIETIHVVKHGHCRNQTNVSYVHCKVKPSHDFCKCSAIGDPHYNTYDGQTIHFFGDCKYLLTEYQRRNDRCNFEIVVKNDHKGNHNKLTCTKAVYIHMFGDVFTIGQHGLKVNGKHQNIPYVKGVDVRVFVSGKLLQFVAPRCGVNVAFDGACNLYVEVSRRYGGKMKGICGDCDGHKNDFRTRSGKDVSGHPNKYNLIGDSYLIKDKHRHCHHKTRFNLRQICKGEWKSKVKEISQCGSLLSRSGPFARCSSNHKVAMKDFYIDCKIDVCSTSGHGKHRESARCKILEGVAEICAEAGFPGIRWRTALKCPLKCGNNQHFSAKATPCPRTCENHFYGSQNPCYHLPEREGCECNEGYLRDGALCVKPSQCTCIDVCNDRAKATHCEEWKKQGKCKKFKEQMQMLCKKSCGFCRVKSHRCRDELNTWKCIQFRDQGKCAEDFYKTVCGLTCNYNKCACHKDRKVVGPCHPMERKQTITYYHFIRNRHGRCIKIVKQRTRVCNCPFKYQSHRGPCNFCTGRITVTIFIQKKVHHECLRRSSHTFLPCSRCPPHPRHLSNCLHDNIIVDTTIFNKRIGCFKCVRARISTSRSIRCRNTKIVGRCNPRTCIMTTTYINRRPCNCRCLEKRYHKSRLCCCRPKDRDVKPFCCNGKIIHRRIKYRFYKGACHPHFVDRIEKPVCHVRSGAKGVCHRYRHKKFYCIAVDRYFYGFVNSKCKCVEKSYTRHRKCCCRRPEHYTNCNKELGIIEYVKITYTLEGKGYKLYCRKHIKRTKRIISFPTRYIRKRGKCNRKCIRTDTIFKKYRYGCIIRKVFHRIDSKLCCCLPSQVTRSTCCANYIIITRVYKRLLHNCHCIEVLFSRRNTIVNCPCQRIIRSGCIYPGHKRLVTIIYYKAIHCRCVRKHKSYKEQCRPCPYKVYKTRVTKCNTDNCLQKVITYYQDVDCRYKVRRCDQLCCCKDRPWERKYCDENTGITYTIRYWYVFDRKTKTCCEKSKKTSSSVACILIVKIKTGKCGKDRKHYKKRTLTRYGLDKKSCSCKPITEVQWLICDCDSPKYSHWRCVKGHMERDVTTYSIDHRGNRCIARTFKEIKCIYCPRPRPDQIVQINRCKYAIYHYFYRIVNCKCLLKRKRSIFVKCCLKHPSFIRKCVNGNTVVITTTIYKVRPDRRRCIAVVIIHSRVIKCKVYIKRYRTPCIRGKFFRVTEYFGVKNCACVRIRVRKVPVICECFPKKPVIKTVCLGNKWQTTVTIFKLHCGKCIPCSTYSDRFIQCTPEHRTRGLCNRKTGLIAVRLVYYVIIHCKCVRRIRNYYVKCPCLKRDRIIRPLCISKTRIVRRERLVEVNHKCKWVTIETEIEDCRCPRSTSITKCYRNVVYRTTTTYYELVLMHLKLPVRRCRKRSQDRFKSIICNRDYKYTTPCKNYQQSVISCTYHKVNCKCQERCRVECVHACNCRHKNYCQRKCIRNVKYNVCHNFHRCGTRCVRHCGESISRTVIPVSCSPPFVPVVCTKCDIYRHNGYYKKCTHFFVVYENCQCKIRSRVTLQLCRCRHKWVARPYCRRNHHVTVTTYYIVRHGLCFPKRIERLRFICCPRPFVTIRTLRCVIEYRLTYYRKRHCQCVRKYRIKYNKTCCHRTTISKHCKHNYWVFIERRYVQVKTNIKLFPKLPNSPLATFCQCVKRHWTKTVLCRRGYTIYWCNKATHRLRVTIVKFIPINCVCLKKVTIIYESCRKCPKKVIHKSKCHPSGHNGLGYIDVTITYYTITHRNHCKKHVKHRREICRCPKSYSRTYCKNGAMVTETVTYDLHSRPRCARHVCITRRPICCYNHGRPNRWRLIKIKRCYRPGHYTVYIYERDVYNKATCGCHRVTKAVRKEICCKGCFVRHKCARNVRIFTRVCERPRGLKCVVYKTSSAVRIRCPLPVKKRIGPCNSRGFQKYSLTTYTPHRCKCRRRTVFRTERCKCFPKETRTCEGNRWKITTTTFLLTGGHCYPIIKISYQTIFCIQIITFKDYPINKCSFWRYYFNKVVKHCQCVDHFIYKEKLFNCCKHPRTVTTCKNNQIVVRTTHYFVLIQFHCLPRTRISQQRIICPKIVLIKRIKISLCRVKYIYFILVPKNCKCHKKKLREEIKKTCCFDIKPYSKTVCDNRKGALVTYYYTYYLGCDGHCHKKATITITKVHCNRKDCHTSVGPCINHTRLVKLFCKRRIHCRCVMKLVHQSYQCCVREDFQWKVVGRCGKYFRKITYYAYRLDKKTNRCRAEVIRVQRRRCRCPHKRVISVCLKDVYRKLITITYKLNEEKDTCIKTKKEHVTVIRGCTNKEKLVGIVKRTCNKETGRGTITYEYIYAKHCRCLRIRRVKPIICICEKVYPPRHRTYCKYDKITVTETIVANCRGDIVTYITTTHETPITNCDKIVVEKSDCFPTKRGYAISIRYVTKIQYKSRNCKCYRKIIERRKEHCRCRQSWTERKCVRNHVVITIVTISKRKGLCHKSVRTITKKIPCPTHPRITRSRCRGNKYTITTTIYYLSNCRCLSRSTERHCDCVCPKNSVRRHCTGHSSVEVITTTWKRVHCRCQRSINTVVIWPLCPRFIVQTVGPCVHKHHQGFKKITTRRAVQRPRICKCEIVESVRFEICWCAPRIKYRKYCYKNNIIVRETWKYIINVAKNKCELVKVSSVSLVVIAPKTVVTYTRDKATGKETKTTITYTVVNCRVIKHVNIEIYDYTCTKEWKLIKPGKCSGPPRCIRTDVYVRQELRHRRCISVKELKHVKCCCHPSHKVFKYCKHNKNCTLTITFNLKHGNCCPSEKLSCSGIVCPLLIVRKETKCRRRFKIIRLFRFVVRHCKCVLRKFSQTLCRCRCPRPKVVIQCDRRKRIRTKIVTTYSIVNCKCVAKIHKTQVCILCPKDKTIRSKCLPVKGTNYYVITTTRIWYRITRGCHCRAKKSISVMICRCLRNEHRKTWCDRVHHVTNVRITFTVKRCGRCVTKVRYQRHPIVCRPRWWIIKCDSGCMLNCRYGQRIITYTRRIAIGCHCKDLTKVVRCHCRCTGPSRKSKCYGNKIKHIHYSYHLIRCKCVRRHRISWESIVCRSLPPRVEKCREVSKHVFIEYTIYRDRFVLNCRCMIRERRVGKLCRCRGGYTYTRCNRRTNEWVHTRVWFELRSNSCKKQSETRTRIDVCDLTPDCHVISRCREGSQTQRYECKESYRENCRCHHRKVQYIQRCECKPKQIIRGRCNKRNCFREITIITFNLIVLRNNRKRCIPSRKVFRERCGCCRKPVQTKECRDNKLIIQSVSYHFNKRTKVCERTCSLIDQTPECCPAHHEVPGRCNTHTCIQHIHVTTKTLRNCRCIVSKFVKSRECCCKKKDYSVRECIRGNIIKTTTYTHKFVNGHCKTSTSETYKRTHCPVDRVRYGACRKATRTQIKEVLTYQLGNCQCVPKVLCTDVICACPPSFTERKCLRKTGVKRTVFTWYVFNKILHKCFKFQRASLIQIFCHTRPVTVCKPCRVIFHGGVYKSCVTSFEVRIGCHCHRRCSCNYRLCYCPRPYRYVVCENNYRVTKEVYYVRVPSKYKYYDYVCVRKIKVISKYILDCMKPRVIIGPCIHSIRIYTLEYYTLNNCSCVKRIKIFRVVCSCPRPKIISKRCVDNVKKEKKIRYFRLLCDRKTIPTCRCVFIDRIQSVLIRCPRPHFKVKPCKHDVKKIVSIHYEPRNCKCHKVKYTTKIGCEEDCYDMPHCDKIKKLGLCKEPIYYQFECQLTCGYCERCPKDHIVKYVGKCKCRVFEGLKICIRKTIVKHYRVINRRCTHTIDNYWTICNCLNKYPTDKCNKLKKEGRCKEREIIKKCEHTCNRNCHIPCHGVIRRRRCVQRGTHKGKYKVVVIHFVPLGDVCLLKIKKHYEGSCAVCSKVIRKEVTDCVGHVRYILIHYVVKVRGVCVNKIRRIPFSCKQCSRCTETLIGNCVHGYRTVVTVFWANIKHCCKKQSIVNVYRCNKRCAGVTRVSSLCINNKRMEFKIWKSGRKCRSHVASKLVSCVPVPV